MTKLKLIKLTHNYKEQITYCEMFIIVSDYDVYRLLRIIDEAREEIQNNLKCADETRWLTHGIISVNMDETYGNRIVFIFQDRQGDIDKDYDKRIIRLVKLILSKSIFRYERLKQIEESKRLIGSRH